MTQSTQKGWADRLLSIVRQEKLRIIVIVLTILVAWALALWLTPYHERPQTQFVEQKDVAPTYMRAEVVEVYGKDGTARVLEGAQKGQELPVQFYRDNLRVGSTVLISTNTSSDKSNAVLTQWRLPAVIVLLGVMIVLVVLIGGRQGIMSLLGLAVSIGVIAYYIIPRVQAGGDALLASSIGAFAIATVAVTIAHRFRWRTVISLISIYIVLGVVITLAAVSGWAASLSGIYDETSSYLSLGGTANLDMYGILLGGIIIASLGVLDDVVTTQVAAVDELRRAKPHAARRELWQRGMSVGREHLSALINTLALAYVGVALPTILIMSPIVTSSTQLMLTLNNETFSVEIIRTVIASLGIILAIPICTGLAVLLVDKKERVLGWFAKSHLEKISAKK